MANIIEEEYLVNLTLSVHVIFVRDYRVSFSPKIFACGIGRDIPIPNLFGCGV